jgi:probable HAF family extracellular repeat protein
LSKSIGILLLIIGSLWTHARSADAQRALSTYAITDIGTLGGESSEAAGVNSLGDVVGMAMTTEGTSHAFLYRNGRLFDLGTLPGGSSSYATAINDRGDIVGYSGINGYGPGFREFIQGFVWQDGMMRSVGALYCPCSFNVRYGTSKALAVSNAGWVVGDSQTNRGTFRSAFVWDDPILRGLNFDPSHPEDGHAYGINDVHEIVGDANNHAFLAQNGVSRDLGVLPGYVTSSARAVNNKGEVVGVAATATGIARAFLWDLGNMRDLGTLPGDVASEALAINVTSDIVGRSGRADVSRSRATLWHDGAAIDLNGLVSTSGWTLSAATGINDLGQIVGVGTHEGQVRAFLLSPQ